MNARIQELITQATEDVFSDQGFWVDTQVNHEKFANLVINECAELAARRLVDLHTGHSSEYDDAVAMKIRQHFGIK